MNASQIETMRKKVIESAKKAYNTKAYQYWINGGGELCRARRNDLDTVDCKIEILD